ncbi:hypothetical protein GOBAR_DD34685 [Gossypium barbadense]|nr:hypothetical protein GOBAR_DD34685 [Gossypium barbadense]
MALNLAHQIGSLAGTQIAAEVTTGEQSSSATANVSGVRKVPLANLRCNAPGEALSPPILTPPLTPRSAENRPAMMSPSLSAACQAFGTLSPLETAEESSASVAWKEGGKKEEKKGVPVYVMMPLDSVTNGNTVNRKKAMNASLHALKSAGVEGIMIDVWWGLVEREAPGAYNWGGYAELLEMAKKHGLKVQAVMSFHQCGGNVGDSCTIPLPKWVTGEIEKDPDLAYTDQWGRRNYEYLSLGCDTLPVLKGRTPVQCYADFMRAFRDNFKHLLGDTIVMLLEHGERILSSATSIFDGAGVKISVKVAGIHWHYGTRSHAPELTAGYYNTRYRDGYLPIAQMLARHGAVFNFTCIEMRDHEQPQDALCAPEKLVKQVALATGAAQVPLAGENALPRYDEYAHEQILRASSLNVDGSAVDREMCAFTYLRMNPSLFHPDNWRRFVAFVKKMNEGKGARRCWEEVEREAEQFVHVTQPFIQEAAVALMH